MIHLWVHSTNLVPKNSSVTQIVRKTKETKCDTKQTKSNHKERSKTKAKENKLNIKQVKSNKKEDQKIDIHEKERRKRLRHYGR